SKGEGHGERTVRVPYFGNLECRREMRHCNGIKVCEFTDPKIRHARHNSVDPDVAFFAEDGQPPSREQQTLSWFLALRKGHQQCHYEMDPPRMDDTGVKVSAKLCNGPFTLRQSSTISDTSTATQHIVGCTGFQRHHGRREPPFHRYVRVPAFVDISVLRRLID